MIWVYKCNSKNRPHQRAYGDWREFFKAGRIGRWGSTEWVPALERAHKGDTILAYQTDRNELVGLARVTALRSRGNYCDLILEPVMKIGVKLRPLKQADPKINAIPALQPGPVRTLYKISLTDARRLLRQAGIDFVFGGHRQSTYVRVQTNTNHGFSSPSRTTVAEALEGTLTESKRYVRGRSRALKRLALDRGNGVCEICQVDFKKVLSGRGIRVLQVHHRRQLSATKAPPVTRVSELAVVCANCHMLIHSDPKKALAVKVVRRLLGWEQANADR